MSSKFNKHIEFCKNFMKKNKVKPLAHGLTCSNYFKDQ
jgi:hypothetical protein